MITLLVIAIYAVGVLGSAVPAARAVSAKRIYCHGENFQSHRWSMSSDCKRYCQSGCWRTSSTVGMGDSVSGLGIAMAWPIALLPLVVMTLANGTRMPRADRRQLRSEQRRIALDAAIAKAEREAGIR